MARGDPGFAAGFALIAVPIAMDQVSHQAIPAFPWLSKNN